MILNQEVRNRLLHFAQKVSGDSSIEDSKNKLGFIIGYYLGNHMSVFCREGESHLTSFARQFDEYAELPVLVNELRPINFELAKDLARTVYVTRCRVAQGGLANLHLDQTELAVLNVKYMTKVVLKDETLNSLDTVNLGLALLDNALTSK